MYRGHDFAPVLAKGMTTTTGTVSAAVAQWATSAVCAGHSSAAVGAPLFALDGTTWLYLGLLLVKTVGASNDTLTWQLPVVAAHASGFLTKSATASVRLTNGADVGSLGRSTATGTSLLRSRGGAIYAINQAAPAPTVTLGLNQCRAATFAALETFLLTTCANATLPFTLAWWDPTGSVDATNLGEGAPRVSKVWYAPEAIEGKAAFPFVGASLSLAVESLNGAI
jgi:hypothetical protein